MKTLSLNGLKVMAKVKVFVYAANADAAADGRAMTLASKFDCILLLSTIFCSLRFTSAIYV